MVPALSSTMTSSMLNVGGASSSTTVPLPVTLPTVTGTVSSASSVTSALVGNVMVNSITPAGTVIVPSALSVTPLLNMGAPISSGAAVPPPTLNGKLVDVVDGLLSSTV